MVYTEEVKNKLDAILKAFEGFIDGQSYFDIVWSKKIGYVWIMSDHPCDAGAKPLDTPEVMLDHFFNEIINDVIVLRESIRLNEAHSLTKSEEAEVRRRAAAILETIEDGADEYLNYLDEYIQAYHDGCCEDGE